MKAGACLRLVLALGGPLATVEAAAVPDSELVRLLSQEDVHPAELDRLVLNASPDAKDRAVQALLSKPPNTLTSSAAGRAIFLRTRANEAGLALLFKSCLHSAEPQTRRAGLQGLKALNDTALVPLATAMIWDEADAVAAVVYQILLPEAARNTELRGVLTAVIQARSADKRFHLSTSLLGASDLFKTQTTPR